MKDIGNIYRAEIGDGRCRYLWHVGFDSSQLGSALVVIFRSTYEISGTPEMDVVISDDIDFYCHTNISVGKKRGYWSQVGFRQVAEIVPMIFRDTNDYGNPRIQVSQHWYVWEPNQPLRVVGPLTGDLKNAEIGVVLPPDCVVNRMRTGKYGIVYPSYDPCMRPEA